MNVPCLILQNVKVFRLMRLCYLDGDAEYEVKKNIQVPKDKTSISLRDDVLMISKEQRKTEKN